MSDGIIELERRRAHKTSQHSLALHLLLVSNDSAERLKEEQCAVSGKTRKNLEVLKY